jgi:predicted Zn finger-like uncharacterized protein
MRLICPNCQQSFTIADAEAGRTVTCPQCATSFGAPQTYVAPPIEPLVALPSPPPAAPPALNNAPTAATPVIKAATPSSSAPQIEGYAHVHSALLNHQVCRWLAPVALTLVFFLSFFNWFGFYPAGYAAYTQNAWQALFATMSVDPVAEKVFDKEKELNQALSASWWLLPYLLLLLVGLALAWSEPAIKAFHLKLPALVEHWWGHRHALLAACAGLTLLFLLLQCAAGFGLERALAAKIEQATKERREKAKTPEEIQIAEMEIARDMGAFHPRTTLWLRLVVLFHFLALAGIVGETLLVHRGGKPPPRVSVMW